MLRLAFTMNVMLVILLVPCICVCAGSRLREVASVNEDTSRALPIDPKGKHGPVRTAGYFRLNRTKEAEMFYFYFESREDPANDPVVIWMTGGPGCSSELAVFYENGPFRIKDDLTLSDNAFGWDSGHNMIFVDQPIGVGFSYSDSPEDEVFDEKGVAADMLDFVREFLEAHPHLADNELYVTGESYAGHYVPAVTHRLWKFTRDNEGEAINLRGFAIGNGLTDPAIQYGAYADFAHDHGLISDVVYKRMTAAYPACKYAINVCNGHKWHLECKAALTYCQVATVGQVLLSQPHMNVYDIRKTCEGPLCYDFSPMDRYFALPEVREALGVGDRKWEACSMRVHADFMNDWMLDYANLLPEMLADGVRAMIYAGDQDFICNWVGNRRWVDALEWQGADDWSAAHDFEWSVKGKAAGLVREAGPLTFVKVYGAGHMVPMDRAEQSLDMLKHLTGGHRFGQDTQSLRMQPFSRASVLNQA